MIGPEAAMSPRVGLEVLGCLTPGARIKPRRAPHLTPKARPLAALPGATYHEPSQDNDMDIDLDKNRFLLWH